MAAHRPLLRLALHVGFCLVPFCLVVLLPGLRVLHGYTPLLFSEARAESVQDDSIIGLLRDAGLGECRSTWPGLVPATPADVANCPWFGPWPAQITTEGRRRTGVSASLTTYDSRWRATPLLLLGAVWSLLNQTLPPDKIYVAVPLTSRSPSGAKVAFDPAALALLSAIPRVQLLRTPDYGPATKYLAALTSPDVPVDTRLFVCDPVVLAELMSWASLPEYNKAALGSWGDRYPLPNRTRVGVFANKLYSEQNRGSARLSPVRVDILKGVAGILLPKAVFADNMEPFFRAPPSWIVPFWTEDDEWLACNARRVGLPMLVIPSRNIDPVHKFGTQRMSDGSTRYSDGCAFGARDCIMRTTEKASKRSIAAGLAATCGVDPCVGSSVVAEPGAPIATCVPLYDTDRNTYKKGIDHELARRHGYG